MKKLLLEMFLIVALSLSIALLYNALSPSGLRILPKKKPIAVSFQRTAHTILHAQALPSAGEDR